MALQPVAVLGLDGWVNTPKEKMDNLFIHAVEANKSQSVTARDLTYSFQYVIADAAGSPAKLKDEMQKMLISYYEPYYQSVDCSVKVIEDPMKGGALILQIFLQAKDEYGKTYNLAKVSSDINSKTIRWANLNNYGDVNQFNQ